MKNPPRLFGLFLERFRAAPLLSRAGAVLAACLVLTALATFLSWRSLEGRRMAMMAAAVDEQMARLDARVAAYVALLRATRSFMLAEGGTPSADRFATFIANLRIPADYPGIQGIGWSPRVGPGPDDFRILYLEPRDARNNAAFGFNMHSEETRRDAMDRARDTGSYAMTGSLVLKQEIERVVSPGFLIYAPLYANGDVPATVEERRARLRGFVYAPFRAPDFFSSVFRPPASVSVRSISASVANKTPGMLIGEAMRPARHVLTRSITIGGATWELQFQSTARTPFLERAVPVLVLLAGLLISALVFELMRTQVRASRRAEERSATLTQQVQFAELLVGIVSHDLRNPLNVIQLNATMLERAELPETFARCVQRIQSSGAMSIRMVRDLLDFTQARLAGGIPVVRTPGDIVPIVQQVVDGAKLAHPQREIDVQVHGDGTGTWDADRIGQVVSNLLGNALVYGSTAAPILVAFESGDGWVQLRVHNEGEPIPPELLADLFEPLRQGGSQAGASRRNIGLGLYIVQQIALAHGGSVRCESARERGTTFIVDLPRF